MRLALLADPYTLVLRVKPELPFGFDARGANSCLPAVGSKLGIAAGGGRNQRPSCPRDSRNGYEQHYEQQDGFHGARGYVARSLNQGKNLAG